MPFAIRVQLTGLEDLARRLEQMKRGLRNRIVRGGLRKAGQPIKREVVAGLYSGHGVQTALLRRSITIKDRTYTQSGTVILLIGPRSDLRQTVDVSRFPVYRQVGGVRGKTRRGRFVPGVFGRTVRISNPKAGKLHNWPTMMRNPVRYAHLTEKGIGARGNRDAKPFLEPGFEKAKAEAAEAFRGHVEDELAKYGVF